MENKETEQGFSPRLKESIGRVKDLRLLAGEMMIIGKKGGKNRKRWEQQEGKKHNRNER